MVDKRSVASTSHGALMDPFPRKVSPRVEVLLTTHDWLFAGTLEGTKKSFIKEVLR